MKIVSLFLLFIGIVDALVSSKCPLVLLKRPLTPLKTFESIEFTTHCQGIQVLENKSKCLFKIIRPNNILPTLLLCFAGGFISNPSNILSKQFAASTMITLIVMSNSMIINDIFDMEIDKTNNPTRPLISGEIKKKEAILVSSLLIMSSEILNMVVLPRSAQLITRVANLIILIYTPILKRITYLKNISCAALISFSVFFPGFVVQPNIYVTKNAFLLGILSNSVFMGSFINEVLMDIRDKEGDQKNNITTLPVKYGNDRTLDFVTNMLSRLVVVNMLTLTKLYTISAGFAFMFIHMPFFTNLELIKRRNYDAISIKNALIGSIKTLFLVVLYICILRILIE